MAGGWVPPKMWHDPVLWMDRSQNKVADALADFTMDVRKTWQREYDTTLCLQTANVVVQTDGGVRSDNCAAAAFIIGLWGDGRYEPLVAHGTFLHQATVFTAEAIALDEATAKMRELM